MAILFIAAFMIFVGWYTLIYFDEDIEPEEDRKKATDFIKGIPIGIQFTVNDVKQTFKED